MLVSQLEKPFKKISTTEKLGKFFGHISKSTQKTGYGEFIFFDNVSHPFKKYTGFFKNGIPHGPGCVLYSKKFYVSKFEGFFSNGFKHGKGRIVLTGNEDQTIEGQFSRGYLHGKARINFSNKGDISITHFHNGIRHGISFTRFGPSTYHQWKERCIRYRMGEIHGSSYITFMNGKHLKFLYKKGIIIACELWYNHDHSLSTSYNNNNNNNNGYKNRKYFQLNIFNKKSLIRLKGIDITISQMKRNSLINGKGTLYYHDRSMYGSFLNDYASGSMHVRTDSNEMHVIHYKKKKKFARVIRYHLYCTIVHCGNILSQNKDSNIIREGQWIFYDDVSIMKKKFRNGKLNGVCKEYIDRTGDIYYSIYKNGKINRNYTEKYFYGNQRKKKSNENYVIERKLFEGSLLPTNIEILKYQDLLTGKGISTSRNGRIIYGTFINNHVHGICTIKYLDGRIYEGNFINGLRNGKGKLTINNNVIFTCYFKKGIVDEKEKKELRNVKEKSMYVGLGKYDWRNDVFIPIYGDFQTFDKSIKRYTVKKIVSGKIIKGVYYPDKSSIDI